MVEVAVRVDENAVALSLRPGPAPAEIAPHLGAFPALTVRTVTDGYHIWNY